MMNWKKIGRIFNPDDYTLPDGCVTHAQSPQVLDCGDYIRVYFSSRSIDDEGKYISHVCHADYTEDFSTCIGVNESTILEPPNLGTYDQHGVFPLHIFRAPHSKDIFGYITGWFRRDVVLVDSAIGLAVSKDNGKTFNRYAEGPILGPSPQEPFLLADPWVFFEQGIYHMWYVFGVRWISNTDGSIPDRVYKIGHATSHDGIDWRKTEEGKSILPDVIDENECQAHPTVFFHEGVYHMYFCYRSSRDFRSNPRNAYRVGYAYSRDLKVWHRDDYAGGMPRSDSGWDSEMMCYPSFFKKNSKSYLLYNGNKFGKYGFGLAVLEHD